MTAKAPARPATEDPHRRKAREIREAAIRYAEQTWCFELGPVGHVAVVAHGPRNGMPAGRILDGLSPDSPDYDQRLMREFGILRHQIIRLSDSTAAPTAWSIDDEMEKAEQELARLRADRANRKAIEDEVIGRAVGKVDALKAERTAAEKQGTATTETSAPNP